MYIFQQRDIIYYIFQQCSSISRTYFDNLKSNIIHIYFGKILKSEFHQNFLNLGNVI